MMMLLFTNAFIYGTVKTNYGNVSKFNVEQLRVATKLTITPKGDGGLLFMFRRYFAMITAVVMIGLLTACSGPSGPGATQAPQTASTGSVNTTLPTGSVTLNMYIETGFPLPKRLADEFTRQHPNVTFNIREDQFQVITENGPRQMAGPTP